MSDLRLRRPRAAHHDPGALRAGERANATLTFEHHPEAAVPWSLTRHLDTYRDPPIPIDAVRFVDGLRRVVQEKSDATLFTGATAAATDAMRFRGASSSMPWGGSPTASTPRPSPRGTPGVFKPASTRSSPTRTTFDVLDRPS